MSNFEQMPMNEETVDEKPEKEDNENNKKKRGWIGRTIRNTAAGVMLATGVGEALPAESAETKFADKKLDKNEQLVSSENVQVHKLDSIGTRFNNVEAENKDYEIRTISFSQLGFMTPEDFKEEFVKFYKEHKHNYSDIQSSGVKMSDSWSKMYLAFINSKIKKLMGPGHESFVFTKDEWNKIREEYKRLAEQEFLRTQLGVYEETYVGDQKGCTLGKNECTKDQFGNVKVSTGSLLGHADGDFEIVVKMGK